MNPGGLVSLWFPVRTMGPKSSRKLLNTFMKVYPSTELWSTKRYKGFDRTGVGGMLVGFKETATTARGPDYFLKRMSSLSPEILNELKSCRIPTADEFSRLLILKPNELGHVIRREQDVITDDHTIVDYAAARLYHQSPTRKR